MPSGAHFSDWASLVSDRARFGREGRQPAFEALGRSRALQMRLGAYVEIAQSLPVAAQGELAGMPYAVKDLFATSGRHPTCGLAHGLDLGYGGGAEALRRLDDAGAVRIGFCTMTALAFEPSGYNALQVPPRNPWNADFITGGSSSGSAVAVAGGGAVIALGSDTGGSLRIPAHACGVTAWKPTFGAVSTRGAMALAPTLDTIGILARSAADLAVPAAVLSVYQRDPRPLARTVLLADVLAAAEPAVRVACEAGIDAIAATGATIERRHAIEAIEAIDRHALIVLQGEAGRVHRARLGDASLDAMLRKRLGKGLSIDDRTVTASSAARGALAEHFLETVFGDADAILLPVMAVRTPLCSQCDPASPRFDPRLLYRLSAWTRFVNLLGFPAVALPTGFDDRGLPVALQIVGRPGSDPDLIALAMAAQKLTDWHGRIPTGIAYLVADTEPPA